MGTADGPKGKDSNTWLNTATKVESHWTTLTVCRYEPKNGSHWLQQQQQPISFYFACCVSQ